MTTTTIWRTMKRVGFYCYLLDLLPFSPPFGLPVFRMIALPAGVSGDRDGGGRRSSGIWSHCYC